MRRTLVIILLLAGVITGPLPLPSVTSTAKAQGIDPAQELFVSAFLNFKKAEELENSGDLKGAFKTFRMVADTLTRLKQSYPSWQPELVDFRLKRTMEAITRVQGKMGGAAADTGNTAPETPTGVKGTLFDNGEGPITLPPEVELNNGNTTSTPVKPIVRGTVKPPKGTQSAEAEPSTGNVFQDAQRKFEKLQSDLDAARAELEAQRQQNAEMAKELESANNARAKAETARKEAQALAKMVQDQALKIQATGETSSERAKELEAQLKAAQKRNLDMEAELAAADLQVTQLISRSTKLANKASEAGTLPAQIRQLETKLEAEQKAKAEATAKLTATTKERDDARTEIARLTELNKQVDKLMTENTSLVKKLGEAEQLIAGFRTEGPNRDKEVADLRQQVTDGQKALTTAQQQNQQLQTEVGELQKRVGDYTKQIQQFKAEKTASAEDRRRMEEENRLLQGIVMRVLQEDANRAQRKKMVQKELDRLQVQSDVLLTQVSYLTQPVVKLSSAERRLFKKPVLDVQDPNTLIIIKSEEPAPTAPATPTTPDAATPPAAPVPATPPATTAEVKPDPAAPAPAPTPAANTPPTAKPDEMAKLDKPALPTSPVTNPVKEPTSPTTNPATAAANSPKGLPEDARPVAEQAKQAFERENFPEAERLYAKALQMAPNNVYLLSNDGVVKFRAGKYRQAEESFRKALSIAPEDHFCWCTLGIVYYSQDKFDEAVNALTKSLAINPKNPTAHNYLGITAAQKGWIEAALKELETAIQLDPKYADAWFNLAVTHTLRQPANKEEARKAYKKAVELGAEADPAMESSLK